MKSKPAVTFISAVITTIPLWSQDIPPAPQRHDQTGPIYHVTVVDRSVSAVNYQYRRGPTQIDFRGTVLMPQAKGEATVDSKDGRTEVDAKLQHVENPTRFGREYLTYVLWAITPEGQAKNLGEVLADASDKARLHVTTDLQVFGMIVTAEPYASVRLPSDVVVLENQARPDTLGSTQPIRARVELMPRGTYTYNVPANGNPVNNGPKVSMDKYEQMVAVYQALNAVQIARSQGAAQYAPEVMEKAERELREAQKLEADKAGRSKVVTAARQASQTAEDARTVALKRKEDAELAQTREQLVREQQLRAAAEAQARADREAIEAERAARRQNDGRTVAPPPPPAAPPPPPPVERTEAPRANAPDDERRGRMERRGGLFGRLNAAKGTAEVIDSTRGIVVIVHDSDFVFSELNPDASANLARVASVIAAEPGVHVEVEGYTDSGDRQAESVAGQRAEAVRNLLVRAGVNAGSVTARGMGNGRPLTSNANAAGREQNRRVEIVISGDAIGILPGWDKTYSLK